MAVEGFVGWHGQGKTYSAIAFCVEHLLELRARAAKRGEPAPELWSNLPLRGARRFYNWDGFKGLLEDAAQHNLRAMVLVDEAGVWLPARQWSKMDPRVMTFLQQRRRTGAGLDLVWTAPTPEHVDAMLRDVTQIVWACTRVGGSEYSHDEGRPPLYMVRRGYDMHDLSRGKEKQKVKPRHRVVRPFVRAVAELYETTAVDLTTQYDSDESPEYYGAGDRHEPTPVVRMELADQLPDDEGKRGRRGKRA